MEESITTPRAQVLHTLWQAVLNLRRNGNVIVFNHIKARIVWIGIMDVRATEEELKDLENGHDTNS